ncbi:peptide chain release factor N(5)-glutamine methyltransferase [Corynebacterium hindlerae]|uniref:peptide chain release factor N(5)-glutamine methyltransferase n=1 Tax=Corynebacterium hindlerae TaxID=699041 RepID=UPI0031B731AC
MTDVSQAVKAAAATLADAGVASPLHDAQSLAAWCLGISRMDLFLHGADEMPAEYSELIARRAGREPLQHIVGSAPVGHLDLLVGPGVFVPRPETELIGDWAVQRLRGMGVDKPCVVDLCTGSGTLAAYVASLVPSAQVTAVEIDPQAMTWAQRNLDPLGVRTVLGDATAPDLLTNLNGRCDMVLSNPPYVPEATPVEPEVRADPHHAVFSGESGMDVITAMAPTIYRFLAPGGVTAIEHDDATADLVCAVLEQYGFEEIISHQDLGGRDRYVTAMKPAE